jgi:hypothetical protein
MIYVIAADLAAPERTRRPLIDWLDRNLDRRAEILPQIYIVEGALAAEQIMNAIEPLLEADDRLVIVKAATEAIWRGLTPENARWMADNFPGSITDRIPDEAEGVQH